MYAFNQAADSLMQGANSAISMANPAISGAVNTVNRGVSGAVNAATGAVGTVGQGARNIVYGADGRSSSDYPPPRYSEVPERDYSDKRSSNSFSNKGEVEMNSGFRVTNGDFDSTNNGRNENVINDLNDPQNGPSKGGHLYPDLPKDEFQSSENLDDRWKGGEQNTRGDRRREDETQIQTQQSRERGRFPGVKWETSNNRELMESQSPDSFRINIATKKICNAEIDMVPCMVPRITCNGDAGRCYCGPMNCCSGSANIDVGHTLPIPRCVMVPCEELKFCGGYNDERLNGNYDYDSRFGAGFDGDLRGGFNRQRRFSGGYDSGFNGDLNGNHDLKTKVEQDSGICCCKPRRRSYSGSYDKRPNNGFNEGINGSFNGGMNSGFNNRMIEGSDGSMNNGFSSGMSNGFNRNGMSLEMGENMNMSAGCNMFDSNSLAALNGICKSLDAINGALGGLTGNLNNMNGNAGIGTEYNMRTDRGLNLGMNMLSGMNMGVSKGNGMDLGMDGSSGVGQCISTGANFGEMSSSAQVGAGAQEFNVNGFGKSMTNLRKPISQYSNQSANPCDTNRSSSVPAHGFCESISSDLNTMCVDDGDYEIQYIEPDMEEYNRKVKEAQERAEQKRQELIIQRDEEVARKRKEMEKQIEEEYEKRKAGAERQREAEIKERISKAQSDLKKKKQNIMQTFTEKLNAVRDAETEKRRRYEIEVAEANLRSQQLKQQLEELKLGPAKMPAQQIQTVTNVPSYQSDTTMEKKLLAEFNQQMCSIKCQEQKIQEEAANVPLPLFRCACRVDASGLAHLAVCQVMDLDVAMPLVDTVVQIYVANHQVIALCQSAANVRKNSQRRNLRDAVMDYVNASPQSALNVVNLRNVVDRLTAVSVRTKDSCSNDNVCDDTSKCEEKKPEKKKKCNEETAKKPQSSTSKLLSLKKSEDKAGTKVSLNGNN
ncbi:hypothetical protein ACTXT7_008722 [Hymenolepis weldensis]